MTFAFAGISCGGFTVGGTAGIDNIVIDAGKIHQKGNETTTNIDMSSAQDMTIRAADDISLAPADALRISHGNGTPDGVIFSAQALKFLMDGAGKFLNVADNLDDIQIGDLDGFNSNTSITINDTGVEFRDETNNLVERIGASYRRNTDVATFTVNASSAIATGAKTNSMYRIPYNATLTNFDVKVNGSGGFTAAVYVAGSNFGDPLTGRVTGCSLGVQGVTGSSTVFNTPSVTAGNFLFLDVFSNASGSTGAQAFLTFESR